MKKMLFALIACALAVPAMAKPINHESLTQRSIVKSGNYSWSDDTSVKGKIHITINLATQMAYVTRGERLIGVTSISSGKAGYETPQGTFTVLGKEDNHWSKAYEANMPFTMWVNNDGIALHSGVIPGRPASHGCVRLPHGFAEELYKVVDRKSTITIFHQTPAERMSIKAFLAIK